jgi:VWFA-related protein
VAVLCVCSSFTCAQDKKTQNESEIAQDDVIRVNTDLIQTGVAVFDKSGKFVTNLKLEDFQLTVDGKPVSISFFEENTSRRGGRAEERAKRKDSGSETLNYVSDMPAVRGRNILFVVDDLHLSADSHARVKKLISKFIDQEMSPEDTAAVVSASGTIGFLQQFTNEKIVLRAAMKRLNFTREKSATDRTLPPMTEYEALLISQYDREVTDIFAAQEMGNDIESKREVVRGRARTILSLAAAINRRTYSALEQAIRSSAVLPGRKVVFFISDGFILDSANSDSSYRVKRITDAAARTNSVIYSFDAKGLEAGFPEGTAASSKAVAVGYRVQSGERFERQDGSDLLARETGGRLIQNRNDLQTGLTKSIDEATQYYLLAWQPVTEDGKSERLRRIEVQVRNHPELRVRVQRGYFDKHFLADSEEKNRANKKGKDSQAAVSIPDQQLNAAANALVSTRTLPLELAAVYLDVPNEGPLAYVASQIRRDALEFIENGDRAQANIDILGLVYDSNGKREGFFRELLTVDASRSAVAGSEGREIYHNYQIRLKPGLYQIRVAARDAKTGKVGSAVRWLEIPDLSKRQLTLSSLILNERVGDAETKRNNISAVMGASNLRVMVDRRISRKSELRFMIFVYNASRGASGNSRPDVTIQTQVLRGNDIVLSSPARSISAEGQDPARLAYAAEIALATLPAGRYELLIVVQDRAAKSSSSQRVGFEVK